METRTFGELRARVTGGTDRQGGGDGPIVVLMHGYGAPGTDLVSLWRVLDVPREVRFVFPEAPISLDLGYGDSRAWWPIDLGRYDRALRTGKFDDLVDQVPEGLASARDAVTTALDAITRELGPSPLVLGGFSQGSMLALDVALHSDRELAGLVLFSSTLIARSEWLPLMAKRAGLRTVQSHGAQDQILPFVLAEELKTELTKAGLTHRWVPFNGGHEIPPSALEAAGDLIAVTVTPTA